MDVAFVNQVRHPCPIILGALDYESCVAMTRTITIMTTRLQILNHQIYFIKSSVELYNTMSRLNNSLLVGLIKDAVEKMSGMGNPRYAYNVVNCYSMLEETSRKGFEAISKNLTGPCLRQMQKVNTKFRK